MHLVTAMLLADLVKNKELGTVTTQDKKEMGQIVRETQLKLPFAMRATVRMVCKSTVQLLAYICYIRFCIEFLDVNGNWGPWGDGPCSQDSCPGTLNRARECNNPAPANDGSPCATNEGGAEETGVPCNEDMDNCPGMT